MMKLVAVLIVAVVCATLVAAGPQRGSRGQQSGALNQQMGPQQEEGSWGRGQQEGGSQTGSFQSGQQDDEEQEQWNTTQSSKPGGVLGMMGDLMQGMNPFNGQRQQQQQQRSGPQNSLQGQQQRQQRGRPQQSFQDFSGQF